MDNSQLNVSHVLKQRANLNKIYVIFHIIATTLILYFRVAYFLPTKQRYYNIMSPLLAWLVIFVAELLLLFMWIVKQSLYWRPVIWTAFPEKLPKDGELPGVDVFICTADPNKEPTFDVMNTVISAMCLDYPADKLSVYLSDDGGAPVTLNAMKHAWVFATWWLPFCKRYNIRTICPKAYFDGQQYQQISHSTEFIQDTNIIKEKYEIFEKQVRSWNVSNAKASAQDHSQVIQVINGDFVGDDVTIKNPENVNMPLLVYVAREKKPTYPSHFKAGALNVLQRVSSILSNAPYIFFLDCDMYCNDSISARQAMCFYLDPKISQTLAYIQYPQKYHNISETDIYDSEGKTAWHVVFPGSNGLQGPTISGTNLYMKRKALYGFDIDGGVDTVDERYTFGSSYEFIKSLSQINKPNAMRPMDFSPAYLQEAQFVASCVYEEDTQWGKKVGFRYDTVMEDTITAYRLHSNGWKSIYLDPARPQFLGSATTNLNDVLVQHTRWTGGLLYNGLSSKYCPLFYNSSRMQFLQRIFYSWITLFPLDFLPISCFAIIAPISLSYGIPLYPKVSDPFFIPFAFVFISSQMKHLCEVIFINGGSVNSWLNEQRVWMIKCVTCYVYGFIECVKPKLGFQEASFIPTDKAGEDDKAKWYQIGKYDFRTSNMFLVPIVAAVNLNLFSFIAGVTRVIITKSWDTLFVQVFISFYALIISLPVIEGMLFRKDNARIPSSTSFISTLVSLIVLSLGYSILLL